MLSYSHPGVLYKTSLLLVDVTNILFNTYKWKKSLYFWTFPGKSTPTNLSGSVDSAKTSDPFQPFGSDANDPFQSKKGLGDPFSGKDPFAPSASSKATKDSSLGFADFSSVSWA